MEVRPVNMYWCERSPVSFCRESMYSMKPLSKCQTFGIAGLFPAIQLWEVNRNWAGVNIFCCIGMKFWFLQICQKVIYWLGIAIKLSNIKLKDLSKFWKSQQAVYKDILQNAGPVSKVAFCHCPTQTLIATDAVVYISPLLSKIYATYFDQSIVFEDPKCLWH